MSDMSMGVLALCDMEEEYAQLMAEFLRKHRDIPWQLHVYTSVEELLKKEEKSTVDLLVAAESTYSEEMNVLQPGRTVVLNESGVIRWKDLYNVSKYQPAEEVLKELLEIYMSIAKEQLPRFQKGSNTRFIGIYSPIRRCLQTSFALTLSQMLAREHEVLYLNFEHYAGITELLPDMQTRDMADLLYFLTAQGEQFRLRMQTVLRKSGQLDYIPPMKAGQNLLTVTASEWLKLLQKLEELAEYEYVILDLSENMQGLFEILHRCVKVFTLTKEDKIARSKLAQYEQLLALCQYEDILQKTDKLQIPHIKRLPEAAEQYTRGELADYVKGIMRELEE